MSGGVGGDPRGPPAAPIPMVHRFVEKPSPQYLQWFARAGREVSVGVVTLKSGGPDGGWSRSARSALPGDQ
jgi:hypothetical protein